MVRHDGTCSQSPGFVAVINNNSNALCGEVKHPSAYIDSASNELQCKANSSRMLVCGGGGGGGSSRCVMHAYIVDGRTVVCTRASCVSSISIRFNRFDLPHFRWFYDGRTSKRWIYAWNGGRGTCTKYVALLFIRQHMAEDGGFVPV